MASNLPTIGNYRLVKEIASGGFGCVYFANRKATIKPRQAHLSEKEQMTLSGLMSYPTSYYNEDKYRLHFLLDSYPIARK